MTNQNSSMIVALGVMALGVTAAVCVANSGSLTSSPVADVAPRGIVLADKTMGQVKIPTLGDVKAAEKKSRSDRYNVMVEEPVVGNPMYAPRTLGLDRGGPLPPRRYNITKFGILPQTDWSHGQ